MKKKVVIAFCTLLFVLLGWLICANDVIRNFSRSSVVEEVPPDSTAYEELNPHTVCAIDDISSTNGNGDLFETASIIGWSFTETNLDNSNRTSSLILKNDSHCYESSLLSPGKDWGIQKRADVKIVFSDYSIQSTNIGFYSTIATYPIEDGVYDAYIYCWENDTSFGMAHSGKQIVKDGGSFTLRPWESVETAVGDPTKAGGVEWCCDVIVPQDDKLLLLGWAFQPELDCAKQSVYLRINGKDHTTLPKSRLDVAELFENELYELCGIQALFPDEALPQGESTIQVLVENGGQIYSGAPITVVRIGDTIEKKS